MRLEEDLKAIGCATDAEVSRGHLADLFAETNQDQTPESLLCRWRDAKEYCGLVRWRLGYAGSPPVCSGGRGWVVVSRTHSAAGRRPLRSGVEPWGRTQSSVTSESTRPRQDGRVPPRSACPARLETAGWHLEVTRTELDPIVLDSDYGLVAARPAFDGCNIAWRAVACPWDPVADEERLAPTIADLKTEAQAKMDQELVLAGRKAAEKDGGD